jgi:hypothetical protein
MQHATSEKNSKKDALLLRPMAFKPVSLLSDFDRTLPLLSLFCGNKSAVLCSRCWTRSAVRASVLETMERHVLPHVGSGSDHGTLIPPQFSTCKLADRSAGHVLMPII